MNTTEEQKQIIESEDQHMIVVASAGTGKTTTMVEKVAYMLNNKQVAPSKLLMTSFSRIANSELKEKLSEKVDKFTLDQVTIKTIHALCYEYVSLHRERVGLKKFFVVDLNYYATVIQNTFKYPPYDCDLKKEDISRSQANTFASQFHRVKTNNARKGKKCASTEGLEYPLSLVFSITEEKMRKSNKITFSDIQIFFLYLLATSKDIQEEVANRFDCLVIDECQDTAEIQFDIMDFFVSDETKTITIGDARQCQPKGTKILMWDGSEKNIEDIKKGDYVVTYSRKDGAIRGLFTKRNGTPRGSLGFKVEEAKSRSVNEDLVVIESGGKISKYTDHHRCFARFNPNNIDVPVLYLMEKDGWFRIGHSNLWGRENNFDFMSGRHRAEKATKLWILKFCKSHKEASWDEKYYSIRYGIPQIIFKWHSKDRYEKYLETSNFYNRFEEGWLLGKAKELLNFFGKKYEYPLYEKQNGTSYFSKNHIFEIRACNLFAKYMDVMHLRDREKKYLKIDKVYPERYKDKIYSLKVQKYECYFADGILTHNTIYGFAGSHYSYWNRFNRKRGGKVYKLSETFRFGQSVAGMANKLSDRMEVPEYFKGDTKTSVPVDNHIKVDLSHWDGYARVREICNDIERKVREGFQLKDIHIMYRLNRESVIFEQELTRRRIPYRTLKGSFIDRREIRFVLNSLMLFEGFTREGLLFVVREFPNFIDAKTLWWVEHSLLRTMSTDDMTLLDILQHGIMEEIKGVGYKKKEQFRVLYDRFKLVSDLVEAIDLSDKDQREGFIEKFASEMEIDKTKFMNNANSDTGQSLIAEMSAFISKLGELFTEMEFKSIEEFINKLKINFGPSYDSEAEDFNGVTLRTIHKSKGCTLPVVYLIADSIGWNKQGLVDELFVYYVAVTRPANYLQIYHSDIAEFPFVDFFPKEGVRFVGSDRSSDNLHDVNIASWSKKY